MAIEVRRKEGESISSFLFRFNKKVQRSGLVREMKKRQFRTRPINLRKRRLSALHKLKKRQEFAFLKKMGYR